MKYYLSIVKHKTKLLFIFKTRNLNTGLNTNPGSFINPILYTFLNSTRFKTLLDYYLHANLVIETWAFTQICISLLSDGNLEYYEGKGKGGNLSQRCLDTFLLVIPHSSKTPGKKGKKIVLFFCICRIVEPLLIFMASPPSHLEQL